MGNYVKKTYNQMVVDSFQRSQVQDIRIEEISEDKCLAVNVDNHSMYNIWMSETSIDFCECPHHKYRQVPCKHMFAAADYFKKSV